MKPIITNHPHFRENTVLEEYELNILFNGGGMGDGIFRFPAIKYILENCPNVVPHVWVPDYLWELTKACFPNADVQKHSDRHKFNGTILGVYCEKNNPTSMRIHGVDYGFQCILDFVPFDISIKNYINLPVQRDVSRFNLPEKYVVLCAGARFSVREMPAKTANELVDYINSKGYSVVFLGHHNENTGVQGKDLVTHFNRQINYDKGFNLINNTTLLEAHSIISKAKCIAGVDNGLIHLAGMTDIPIVAGYTTVEPQYRLPIRNNQLGWNCHVIEPDVACRGCQSKWTSLFKWDFKDCYYGDTMCVTQMTTDKFVKQLEKVL